MNEPAPPKIDFLFDQDAEGRYLCLHPECADKESIF
jgi:hypothetical protein